MLYDIIVPCYLMLSRVILILYCTSLFRTHFLSPCLPLFARTTRDMRDKQRLSVSLYVSMSLVVLANRGVSVSLVSCLERERERHRDRETATATETERQSD